MKPTQEQAVAWAKEVSGVEFPTGTAGVKIGMNPEHLESVAALAYEAGRKDENEECGKICDAAQIFGNIDERWAAKCCADQIRARRE